MGGTILGLAWSSVRRGTVIVVPAALGLAATLAVPAIAGVSPTPDPTATTDGGVYAIAQAGDRTIIGGLFTRAGGRPHSNLAAIAPDGTADHTFAPGPSALEPGSHCPRWHRRPHLRAGDGLVDAVAVSSDGETLFVGGQFNTVNGTARANLAALDADTGALIDSWQADTTGTTPDVKALTVVGTTLYVGGRFGGIDGTGRKRFVALNSATGDLVPAFRPAPNGGITELEASPDGTVIYAGGSFSILGGQPRVSGGAVFASGGLATSFAPTISGGNGVTIGLSPDGLTYFVGTENNTVYAFDTGVADSLKWSVKMSGNTQAMAVSDTEIYIGGHFSQYLPTKTSRPFLGSLNVTNGALTSWNTMATGGKAGVWALLIDGPHLHAGGLFKAFNGTPQPRYARFTGTP